MLIPLKLIIIITIILLKSNYYRLKIIKMLLSYSFERRS